MFKSILQRLINSSDHATSDRFVKRKNLHRALRMENLAKREVMASDIAAISGVVFVDLDGDSVVDTADTKLAGVDVRLFRDGGDGVFGGDDTLVGTDISDALASATPGAYRFDGLTAGLYFIQQDNADAPAGLINPSPTTVTVTAGNADGVQVQSIDTYSQTAQSLIVNSLNTTRTESLAAPETVGGERDVRVNYTSGTGDVQFQIDATNDQLRLSSQTGTVGTALIQYDGVDGAITLAATGLGGISLNGGDNLGGINVRAQVDAVADSFQLNVYTSATAFSTVTVAYPAAAVVALVDIFIPFADFVQGGTAAAPADFNNVGAIELQTDVSSGRDIIISVLDSVRPDIQTVNVRNIQPVTIGNLVFQDTNGNGLFGAGESGIAGVDVELYSVASLSAVVDPATSTLIGTQTTDTNGAYSFTGLTPGFYAAVIPARELDATSVATGARTLVGFSTSTPTPETAGANANVDSDDDGRAVTGQLYIASGTFELIAGDEPSGGGNTNNTFDFGFVPNADLGVTKTFVSLDTATNGTRTATFRIDVINNGPIAATGVTVIDTIPTGLTFDRVTSTANPLVAPAGVQGSTVGTGTVTFDIIDLASSAGTSFNVVFIVGATVFGDRTNSASIDGDQNDPVATNNSDDAILDVPETDLSITKSLETTGGNAIPPAAARTGDTVVYRITVNNDAANSATIDDAATGVTVVDTLPTGVTFVSGTINGGAAGAGISFNSTTREVTATVGNVNRGTPAVILLTVTINTDAADLITNSATVSNLPDTDNVTSNDTASVDNNVSRAVDLAVVKSVSTNPADNRTAIFGAPITFTVTVTNAGTTGNARGFTVTDTLPTGLTLVTNSFDAGTSGVTIQSTGQALTFTGGALNIGQSVSFTFDALVAQGAPASITNTATVAPINAGAIVDVDTNAANNSESETITPARNVELVVTKDDNFTGTNAATPGGNIVYTIIVSNTGTSDAVNVNVTDTLPAGVTATSITLNGAQLVDNDPAAGTLAFVLPSVPTGAGNAVTVLVNATIAASATVSITNNVAISGGGTGDLPAGNAASVTTPLTPDINVQVVKTGPTSAVPGGAAITYNLAISNSGLSNATNVSVADDLPAGVTIQSVTLNGTAVTNTGTNGDVAFVIPTLAPGTTGAQTAVITVLVNADTVGTLSNTATVTATGDTTPLNNTSTITTPLTPTADVTVTKTVNNATANSGSSLTYTIQVRNGGVSTAAGVTLVDVLPTGLTFASGTGPNNQVLTANGQTVNVAVGTLAPNATQTYTIIAAIGSTFVGQLVNPATVATTTSEGANALANTASATTTVTDVDPANGSISGRVFRDGNRDGLFNNSDAGISGVTVRLRNSGNATVLQTKTTAADGTYSFTGLVAGTYEVEEVQPTGVNDGLERAGSTATPAEIADGIFRSIGLARTQALTGFDYAEVELLSKRRFLAST